MEEVDVAETLKTLSAKIDELSNALIEKKSKAEEKIKESPLACVGGAFFGGLVLGYLMSRKS